MAGLWLFVRLAQFWYDRSLLHVDITPALVVEDFYNESVFLIMDHAIVKVGKNIGFEYEPSRIPGTY